MRLSTLHNLIWMCVWLLLGLFAFVGVCMGAWWHWFTTGVCAVFAWMMLVDDEYDVESVRAYFRRKRKGVEQ